MSSRFLPHDTAAGALVQMPPRGSQSDTEGRQALPSHALWNMSLSLPRPQMSNRFAAHETATAPILFIDLPLLHTRSRSVTGPRAPCYLFALSFKWYVLGIPLTHPTTRSCVGVARAAQPALLGKA